MDVSLLLRRHYSCLCLDKRLEYMGAASRGDFKSRKERAMNTDQIEELSAFTGGHIPGNLCVSGLNP